MNNLSFGKYFNLLKCTTKNGAFSIIAIDHRNNLRNAMNPENPELIKETQMSEFKKKVVQTLSPNSSSVLLDPEIGAFQIINSNTLDKNSGLIIALEQTGYKGLPYERISSILSNWTVEKAKMLGANAVKLLVYYNSTSKCTKNVENLLTNVVNDCEEFDIPLFLEILTYSTDPQKKKLISEERKSVIIESANRLGSIGGDVLKLEFPIDIQRNNDADNWFKACEELSKSIVQPWVLLSASVDFETYLHQVYIACLAGSSGVAAGRAVWKEAIGIPEIDRINFLNEIASKRMSKLTNLVDAFGRPVFDFYQTNVTDCNTYKKYFD